MTNSVTWNKVRLYISYEIFQQDQDSLRVTIYGVSLYVLLALDVINK